MDDQCGAEGGLDRSLIDEYRGSMMKAGRRAGPLTFIGLILILGATALAAEIVFESTYLTWKSGLQMVGFSLFHGGLGLLGLLCVFMAGAWVIIVLVLAAIRRSIGSTFNLVLIGIYALDIAALSVPYETWVSGMAYLTSGQPRAEWLIYGTASGDTRLVRYLISKGVDVNAASRDGQTALGAAASGGQTEIGHMLLSQHARTDTRTAGVGETPLIEAAEMNHLDMVKLLIEYGADPNARMTHACRCTALDWAIKNGNQEMADFLRAHMDSQ